tara:strand:- start:31870 stop:32544 length:675 start_codon:yes stop_codon:yes gene_type:complete
MISDPAMSAGRNPDHGQVLGVIMAAGRSTRFGPDDKRLAELNGEPLLMQLVRRLLPVFPPFRDQPRLSVVLRPEDVTLAASLPAGCLPLFAADADAGLGSSIASAVARVAGEQTWQPVSSLAVFLGDMPLIRTATLGPLLREQNSERIVRPEYQGKAGHPVLFGRRFWPDLMRLQGEDGARTVIQNYPGHLIRIATDDPGVITDIDTPQQLAAVQQQPAPLSAQ